MSIQLDHLIIRVKDQAASVLFYARVLGFEHVGRAEPFEIVRVNPGLTLDLLQEPPQDSLHLAFRLEKEDFEKVHRRLRQFSIPFGGDVFDRDGGAPGRSLGAQGMGDALYFYDPDGNNIEIRLYSQI